MNIEQLIALAIKQNSVKAAIAIIGAWAFEAILPIAKFVLIVFVLVATDLFTGVWASMSVGKRITSTGLFSTIGKFIAYTIAIILSHIMQIGFMEDNLLNNIPLVYIVSFFIGTVEFQSNIENIGSITGVDIWSRIQTVIMTTSNNFLKNLKSK